MYDETEDDYYEAGSSSLVPKEVRTLRACLICGFITTYEQFNSTGCPNCPYEQVGGDAVGTCTTPNFEGMIAMIEPTKSWVAKWQRTQSKSPGCYAVVVHGRLGGEMINYLQEQGIQYHPLDGTD